MSYVDNNLMKDEEVVYRAKLHWFIFIKPILVFLLGLLIPGGVGTILIVVGILYGITKLLDFITSEFAITNKRVIVKVGFLSRNSLETLLEKIEGIKVNQGLFGRILNFGTIIVSGTGGSRDPFKNISNPLQFRREVQEQIASSSEK